MISFLKYLDQDQEDEDENKLEEKAKKYKMNKVRDIVQFISFEQLKDKPEELILQTIEEIPKQIIEYM